MTCPEHYSVPHFWVNPRGLVPNHLWQLDVTHIPEFGRLRYVHVSIDTLLGFILDTPKTGEATKHVISHCLKCFAVVGQANMIKTDNGSRSISQTF